MFDFVFSVENGITGNQRTDEDEDDRDEVFTVELMRGPHGLGLALVDGMVRLILSKSKPCFICRRMVLHIHFFV